MRVLLSTQSAELRSAEACVRNHRKETKGDEAAGFGRVPPTSRQRLNSAKSFGSMRSMFHSLANHAARLLMKLWFACVARVRVVRREHAHNDGESVLSANSA